MKFTRGFTGRGKAERDPRLPPGQYDTGKSWPVLTAEVTPKLDTSAWTFGIEGLVETPTTFTTERPCDRKANRPPSPEALTAAANLLGDEGRPVVVDLAGYAELAEGAS